MDLLKANFRFATGHLLKNKHYSILNIVGLAFGMTCSFLILLWVYNELKFDNFHTKKDRLYQVFMYLKQSDGDARISSSVSAPLAGALLGEVPEIKTVTRIPWSIRNLVKYNDKAFFEKGIYADTSFFEMFSFNLKKGNAVSVLKNPTSIVISEKFAEKYFEGEDPVGKTLTIRMDKDYSFMVTGLMETVPSNSSLQFDYVLPFQFRLHDQKWLNSWGELSLDIYIEAYPNASVEAINSKIKNIYKKHYPELQGELFVQQFSKTHLYSLEYKDEKQDGKITLIYILTSIAVIILLIACINYINLATALASKRSREVGVKKVLGSSRQSLIIQYLSESFIVTFIALLIMIMLIELLLPQFNLLFSRNIEMAYSDLAILSMILLSWFFTAVISGIYPAFAISKLSPVIILKSKVKAGGRRWQRQALVVFQFTITIALIICMFFFNQQIHYINTKNLGLEKENVLFFHYYNGISKHKEAFKSELMASANIENVTFTSMNPLNVNHSTTDPVWEGKSPNDDRWFSIMITDFDFAKTFGARFKEGRDFSAALPSDSSNFIINEKAREAMGFKTAIGQKLSLYGKNGTIIGVVEDFHVGHLSQPIPPLVILVQPDITSNIFVKAKSGKIEDAINSCKKVFTTYEQDYPFEYTFQTDFFNNVYKNNLLLIGKMSSIFSILAIVISCLGLYGLTAFMAEQRTKEIGIRKVNGARLHDILRLLLVDFLKWVALAYLIGIFIAWFVSTKFINNFTYHSEQSIWVFINAGLAAFLIALVTVSWQAYKAASQNPVEALRYE